MCFFVHVIVRRAVLIRQEIYTARGSFIFRSPLMHRTDAIIFPNGRPLSSKAGNLIALRSPFICLLFFFCPLGEGFPWLKIRFHPYSISRRRPSRFRTSISKGPVLEFILSRWTSTRISPITFCDFKATRYTTRSSELGLGSFDPQRGLTSEFRCSSQRLCFEQRGPRRYSMHVLIQNPDDISNSK